MFSISYLPRLVFREFDLRSVSMKVWIDVLTPKHALFFEPLYRDLARQGHELLVTTRTYREAQEALELKRLPFRTVGEHGGASRYVCSPWIIPRRVWLSFGARPDGIVAYRALDAAAWLKRHRPNPAVLKQLSLKSGRPIILLRTEESFASYLEGKASDKTPVIGPVTEEILRRKLDAQIVISTRYGRQAPVLRQMFGNRVRVIDHIVDTTSLLYYSTIFIGSGGTMTVEAALLGRPAISCFPVPKPLYIKYL